MSVAKFADVVKSAKDLLSKPYPESHKVELKTAAANGVTFTAEAALGPVPAPKPGKKPTPALSVKGEGVVRGNFKVDKLSVDTNRDITGEFSLAEAFKGTKLTFKATDGTRAAAIEGVDPISAVFGVEHRADFGTFTVDVDVLKYSVEAAGVATYNGVLAGATAKVARSKDGAFGVDEYGALVGYKKGDITFAVQSEKKFESYFVAYHQIVSSVLTVAATAKVPAAVADAKKFQVAAGAQYKTDATTTVAGKIDHEGKLGFSYAQQLSALTKITIGAEIDAPKIASDNAHKLAIAVAFSA